MPVLPAWLTALPWKAIGLAVAALALIALIVSLVIGFGNARYDAGVADTDAKWKLASEKLEEESRASARGADKEADSREAEFTERLEQERRELERAAQEGQSPFDILFP